jgi:hypothetical protein
MNGQPLHRLGLTLLILWGMLQPGRPAAATRAADLAAAFTEREHQGLALVLTDIHLDPLADEGLATRLRDAPVEQWASILEQTSGSHLFTYGKDSSYPLVRSAIHAASTTGLDYDLVLVTGDYLAHHLRREYTAATGSDDGFDTFVVNAELFLMHQLENAFPGTPIIATLGNNDTICGDYRIEPAGPLLEGVASEWMRLTRADEGTAHFPLGGYYTMPHPVVPDHELIVLNNILWSVNYHNACGKGDPDPGDAELLWLEWTLYRLEQQGHTATLLMHIPPGQDAYASTRCCKPCNAPPTPFMAARYSEPFLALLRKHASVLRASFAGHTHMDNLAILEAADGTPRLFTKITPAVSPMFGNNPAFAVLQYDRTTGTILDQAVVILDNLEAANDGTEPHWAHEYTFSRAYGTTEMTATTLAALADSLKTDVTLRATFLDYYDAGSTKPSACDDDTWIYYSCAQTELDARSYTACRCPSWWD